MSTLTSPRQQAVTLAQVRNKVWEAKQRVANALKASQKATCAADYNTAVRDLTKAADEHHNWSIVLRALERRR